MTTKTMKILLSVAFLGVGLANMGCDERDWQHYYGGGGDYSYTDVGIGVGFYPAWSDYTVVDEYQVVTPYYDTGGYYDSGYDSGYYDSGYYDGYYGDCPDCAYKAKLAGRSK